MAPGSSWQNKGSPTLRMNRERAVHTRMIEFSDLFRGPLKRNEWLKFGIDIYEHSDNL